MGISPSRIGAIKEKKMKITISNNGENRTVVDEAKDDKPKNGGRFNWSRLGPVNQVQENYSGRGSGPKNKKSANERLIRSGSLEVSNDALSASQNSGKGGRGRGTGRGSGKQRKSANERLVRAPQAPTSASRFRGGSEELNNNIVNEPMEVDIQPPVRRDTDSPDCICLRPLKMVLCRICGHNFEGRVQKTCSNTQWILISLMYLDAPAPLVEFMPKTFWSILFPKITFQ